MTRRDTIADMSVAEIMERWPNTIGVFIRRDLSCVGCPVGGFHNLREVAEAHHVAEGDLLAALEGALEERSAQQAGTAAIANEDEPVGIANEELLPSTLDEALGFPRAQDA